MTVQTIMGYCGNDKLLVKDIFDILKKKYPQLQVISFPKTIIMHSNDLITIRSEDSITIYFPPMTNPKSHMNSFVEIDSMRCRIVRDYWGTHSIYYSYYREGFVFSSEIRMLYLIVPNLFSKYDLSSIESISCLGYIYSGVNTIYSDIKQLKRNYQIEFKNKKIIVNECKKDFVRYQFNNILDAAECLKYTFQEIVNEAINLSGNKAFLLSGGMDSSWLAIEASQKKKINTFTFESDNNKEDVYYANYLAKILQSNHENITFPNDILKELPSYIKSIESVELEGIFSPLGGYAYYLLVKEISNMGFDIVYIGEGADELFGGYYWPLTHAFGFVDKLHKQCEGSYLDKIISSIFRLPENNIRFRKKAYKMLQGTALTNYHLNCIDHVAKEFGVISYLVFMDYRIIEIIKNVPIDWLCNGIDTKLMIRTILQKYLEEHNMMKLVNRKKLAMPSVIPKNDILKIIRLSDSTYHSCNHHYYNILGKKTINCFLFDILHKYYTLDPLGQLDRLEWCLDLEKMVKKHEPIIHW